MKHPRTRLALAVALIATTALPAAAQHDAHAGADSTARATGLAADLLKDIDDVESKIVGLARAIPADKYGWRPAEGVRSVGEVLMHVAADNYLLPAAIGHAADAASGVRGDDYKTAQAFEQRKLDKDAAIAAVEHSFAYLRKALSATPSDGMSKQASLFGQTFTGQQAWIMTTTHLHEHLGQLIAYARSNGVVPPWSRGG